MAQEEEEFAVFMGGLKIDIRISVLKKKIVQLFAEHLLISLASCDINIVAQPANRFGFIYFSRAEELQTALTRLGTPAARHLIDFDFAEIGCKSRPLTVHIKLNKKELLSRELALKEHSSGQEGNLDVHLGTKSLKQLCNVREAARLDSEHLPPESRSSFGGLEDCTGTGRISDDDRKFDVSPANSSRQTSLPTINEAAYFSSIVHLQNAKTSTTGLYKKHPVKHGNVGTSTTGLISDQSSLQSLPDKYLIIGQLLGNETRNVEFKRGGGQYMKRQLKDHVAKYVCCFLNAGEGGNLLIGVDDNGAVQGVECNQKQENELRLLIDSVIKGMVPQVFPQQYSVSFVPVLELFRQHLTPIADVKVIEIQVSSAVKCERLYETYRGDVFIRRDGSVQGPLRASDIQEWTRMIHRQEDWGRRGEIDRLTAEINVHKEREEELRSLQQELLSEVELLRVSRTSKPSKVCVVL